MPRIVLRDLPPVRDLSPEEAAGLFGAGPKSFRPRWEALEERKLMSASLATSLVAHAVQPAQPATQAVSARVMTSQVATPQVATPHVAAQQVATPLVATQHTAVQQVGTPLVTTPLVATPQVRSSQVAVAQVATPQVRSSQVAVAQVAQVATPQVHTGGYATGTATSSTGQSSVATMTPSQLLQSVTTQSQPIGHAIGTATSTTAASPLPTTPLGTTSISKPLPTTPLVAASGGSTSSAPSNSTTLSGAATSLGARASGTGTVTNLNTTSTGVNRSGSTTTQPPSSTVVGARTSGIGTVTNPNTASTGVRRTDSTTTQSASSQVSLGAGTYALQDTEVIAPGTTVSPAAGTYVDVGLSKAPVPGGQLVTQGEKLQQQAQQTIQAQELARRLFPVKLASGPTGLVGVPQSNFLGDVVQGPNGLTFVPKANVQAALKAGKIKTQDDLVALVKANYQSYLSTHTSDLIPTIPEGTPVATVQASQDYVNMLLLLGTGIDQLGGDAGATPPAAIDLAKEFNTAVTQAAAAAAGSNNSAHTTGAGAGATNQERAAADTGGLNTTSTTKPTAEVKSASPGTGGSHEAQPTLSSGTVNTSSSSRAPTTTDSTAPESGQAGSASSDTAAGPNEPAQPAKTDDTASRTKQRSDAVPPSPIHEFSKADEERVKEAGREEAPGTNIPTAVDSTTTPGSTSAHLDMAAQQIGNLVVKAKPETANYLDTLVPAIKQVLEHSASTRAAASDVVPDLVTAGVSFNVVLAGDTISVSLNTKTGDILLTTGAGVAVSKQLIGASPTLQGSYLLGSDRSGAKINDVALGDGVSFSGQKDAFARGVSFNQSGTFVDVAVAPPSLGASVYKTYTIKVTSAQQLTQIAALESNIVANEVHNANAALHQELNRITTVTKDIPVVGTLVSVDSAALGLVGDAYDLKANLDNQVQQAVHAGTEYVFQHGGIGAVVQQGANALVSADRQVAIAAVSAAQQGEHALYSAVQQGGQALNSAVQQGGQALNSAVQQGGQAFGSLVQQGGNAFGFVSQQVRGLFGGSHK